MSPIYKYNGIVCGFQTHRRCIYKMDDSWWMRMTMPSLKPDLPGRKSAGDDTSRRNLGDYQTLDPINFDDVFGGPPRTVLSRQFSAAEFSRQTFSYEEIFQQSFHTLPSERENVRNLTEFRMPASRVGRENEEEFYGDIFGELRRSRSRSHQSITNSYSKSKSNSSSVLSPEELSPSRPAVVDEDVSAYASNLRPINVSSKWNSSAMMHDVRQMPEAMPAFPSNLSSYFEKQFSENKQRENFGSSHSGKVSSPESIFVEPSLYCSNKVSVQDLQLNSPSSVVSSLCHDHETEANRSMDHVSQEQISDQEEEEDEIMSSYVIEINVDKREGKDESQGIDEAIAWAKEKYQAASPEKEWTFEEQDQEDSMGLQERTDANHVRRIIGGPGSTLSQLCKRPEELATEMEKQLERDIELELLDEDVRLWSTGKEANIRLLLSTLHHILWPSSGWCTIPSSNLKESADVKKAYQKARLCLHPDKLQQRGATFPQKYVADMAFPILQDAWAAFISQDVFQSST